MATIATKSTAVSATKLETNLTDVDAGVLKDIPGKTAITVNGMAMTPAQIDTQVKSYLATIGAADTAKAAYQTALVARRNIQIEARDFYLQLKKAIIAYFGTQSAQLADFGLTPAKAKAPKTSAETAIIAAKAALTRQARGTSSKKKKAAINPGTGTPAMAISGSATAITPPTVVDAPLPGSTASTTAGNTSSTAASSNGSAPATGVTGSTVTTGK